MLSIVCNYRFEKAYGVKRGGQPMVQTDMKMTMIRTLERIMRARVMCPQRAEALSLVHSNKIITKRWLFESKT